MVHVHADQLFADGLDQQCGDNGGVHAPGQCQQHFLIADLFSQLSDLLFDKGLCKRLIGDAFHGFRTFVSLHTRSLRK